MFGILEILFKKQEHVPSTLYVVNVLVVIDRFEMTYTHTQTDIHIYFCYLSKEHT